MSKNANGNNKLERQKNKAKKYLDIKLADYSNTYWKIDEYDKANTFILFTNFRIVKDGQLVILEPINRVREYFKKTFGVIYEERPYYYNAYVIFKSYGEKQHEELLEIVRGYDDLYLLSEWIEKNKRTPGQMLIKKSTSGYLDRYGQLHKTKQKKDKAEWDATNETAELLEELEELE